jgi:16S rRNA processing protein RimM
MARTDPSHLVVGFLNRPHGIEGEISVTPLTDHPESVFAPGVVLSLGHAQSDEPDPDLPPMRVEAVRPHRNGLLIRFGGVDDRTQADLLSGRYLFRSIDELEPLAEGEIFHHQLLGMSVVTVEGREVGRVSQVYELHPAELLEVEGSEGHVMVPFTREIVVEVDVDEGRLVIDPPEGLLDLASG